MRDASLALEDPGQGRIEAHVPQVKILQVPNQAEKLFSEAGSVLPSRTNVSSKHSARSGIILKTLELLKSLPGTGCFG